MGWQAESTVEGGGSELGGGGGGKICEGGVGGVGVRQ